LSQALDVDVTPRAAARIEAAAWLVMVITRQILATQLSEYLRHKVTIEQLDGAKAMHHV